MFDMFKDSVTLFLRGKLFQDTNAVMKQIGIGVGITAVLCLLLVLFGVPLWAATIASAFIGGGLQPYLLKDLKYR